MEKLNSYIWSREDVTLHRWLSVAQFIYFVQKLIRWKFSYILYLDTDLKDGQMSAWYSNY